MKKWLITLMVAVPLLLVGCNSDKDEDKVDKNTEAVNPESLELKVEILTPEKLGVNEKVELKAKVSQNNEAIDNADVKFEVWESGYRDKGQMIEGKLDKDGVYKAETTFDHDGVYYMFAHTTANGIHNMPKQKLIVGNPDMSKVLEDNSSDSMDMNNMNNNGGDSMENHGEDSSKHEENFHDNSSHNH